MTENEENRRWHAKQDAQRIRRLVKHGFVFPPGKKDFDEPHDVSVALDCLLDRVDELEAQIEQALDQRQATTNEWEMVGICGVDSGQMRVAMGDPCYGDFSFDETFHSGLGDGGYGVFKRMVHMRDWGHRTAEVRILFLDEGIDGRDSILSLLRQEATEAQTKRLKEHDQKLSGDDGDSHLD